VLKNIILERTLSLLYFTLQCSINCLKHSSLVLRRLNEMKISTYRVVSKSVHGSIICYNSLDVRWRKQIPTSNINVLSFYIIGRWPRHNAIPMVFLLDNLTAICFTSSNNEHNWTQRGTHGELWYWNVSILAKNRPLATSGRRRTKKEENVDNKNLAIAHNTSKAFIGLITPGPWTLG